MSLFRSPPVLLFCASALGLSACFTNTEAPSFEPDNAAFASVEDVFENLGVSPTFEPAATFELAESFVCPADSAEPDSSPDDAVTTGFDSVAHRSACKQDDDWSALQLIKGDDLRVHAVFDSEEGEIRLGLADPSGRIVAQSVFTDDRAILKHKAEQSGEYLLLVRLTEDFGERSGASYTLRIFDGQAPCSSDVFEPNNDEEDSVLFDGGIEGLAVCPGDKDWIRFDLGFGDRLDLSLEQWTAEGRVAFILYGPDGASRGEAFADGTTAEVSTMAELKGSWTLLVYLVEGSHQGVRYDLDVGVTASSQ
ncbi:MAG: hypothetical protein VX498_11700 [Myxococcota bacterium]|nr:hypothetical protein [Myxococcota bacterium]